ncbi:MAG: TRAP transporter large permease subunit [Pseudomonadota bacterium]|nr:TRAP transporter large permease subunit [Pseudomonadota bacterium]
MKELSLESTAHSVKDSLLERLPVVAILLLLIFVIFARTGESVHGQMTQLGAYLWEDYFVLRSEVSTPDCNPHMNIEQRLQQLEAEAGADDFDLFDDALDDGFDRDAARTSLVKQQQQCALAHEQAARYLAQLTPALELYRSVEHVFSQASIFSTEHQTLLLMALLFISAGLATGKRHHISFRPMLSALDHKLSTTLQLTANSSLAISAWFFRHNALSSDIAATNPEIINGLVIGSSALALLSLYQLLTLPKHLPQQGSLTHALLSVPLYTIVMLLFAVIVLVHQQHTAGLSLYFSAFFDHSGTYIDVALYLWCGMLLKQTQLGERVFSLFTPWKLPPELLAFVAIVVMAMPTAYTGASSIIILAMGAVVYRELRKVGTRRQLALAATAMSGSSGIVLKPCLIVVIISILNKEVVTDDLFYWGIRVFLLTAFVFFVYAMITRRDPLQIATARDALPQMTGNAKPLLPYLLVFALVTGAYLWILDARLDQFSAPIILPVIIFWWIVFERKVSRAPALYHEPERQDTLGGSLTYSMTDASIHIGGLLMMMSTFMIITSLGGKTVSASFLLDVSNPFWVMAALMAMFVLIGMFMESMAAVGLVSVAIAPIAYQQGIDPVHFWMTCLVALELGYLSPPVALSHIFTRQVVGEEEATLAAAEGDRFYYRHERLLLPLLVMSTTLLLVGFGPLLVGYQ